MTSPPGRARAQEPERRAPAEEVRLWYAQPSRTWLEALPVGNGRLGAMVHGGIDEEVLDLNVDTLWSGGPRQAAVDDAASRLAELRRLVLHKRDYAAGDELARTLQGPFNESYQPLGSLRLRFGTAGSSVPAGYVRSLDLDQAIASVRVDRNGTADQREVLASAPADVIAVRLHASRPGALDVTIGLDCPHAGPADGGPAENGRVGTLTVTGRAPWHVAPHYHDEDPSWSYEPDRGLRFSAMLRVSAEGGRTAAGGRVIRVEAADAVTVLVTAVTGYTGYDREPVDDAATLTARCRQILAHAAESSYTELRAAHVRDHQALFRRCLLHLPAGDRTRRPTDERLAGLRQGGHDPGLCALFFHYGRYLLIASSRPGTQPANLQGIWNHQIQPPWSSNWTANINVEMNYWPTETTNLAECHEPLLDLVADLAIAGSRTARAFYDCAGWTAHHNIDLWRSTWAVGSGEGNPVWANWPMAGAWLSQHLWEHWRFNGDRSFLAEQAYPLMRGAAEFLLDYLVEEPGGALVTCPSTSPENLFLTPGGAQAGVSAAATMDIWLIRDLFAHCLAACEELDQDADFAVRLRGTLDRLWVPRIAPDGRLQEWQEEFTEAEPGHRHLSHLFALYPGDQITPGQTPQLAAAARRSLEYRLAHGGGGTGWSRAWVIALWARLLDGELAHHHLVELLTGSVAPNLFDLHPPEFFQIDGNLGGTAGIAEMLLHSHGDRIALLPALPSAWPDGHVTGLKARGGATVDITWTRGRATMARVQVPGPATVTVIPPPGQTIAEIDGRPAVTNLSRADGDAIVLSGAAPTAHTLRLA